MLATRWSWCHDTDPGSNKDSKKRLVFLKWWQAPHKSERFQSQPFCFPWMDRDWYPWSSNPVHALIWAGVGPVVFVVTFIRTEVSEPGIICFDSEEHSILVILVPQLNASEWCVLLHERDYVWKFNPLTNSFGTQLVIFFVSCGCTASDMNTSCRAYPSAWTDPKSIRSIKIFRIHQVSRQATSVSGQLWHSESTGSNSMLDNVYDSDVSTAILGMISKGSFQRGHYTAVVAGEVWASILALDVQRCC